MKYIKYYYSMSATHPLVRNLNEDLVYYNFLKDMASKIPSPAYLVIGSSPSEERKSRTYYDNPQYYLYDASEVPVDSTVDKSRYIRADFSDISINIQLTSKRGLFFKKFDVVIMDNAVAKFLTGNPGPLGQLFDMVKPGGKFIIDSVNGLSIIQPNPGESIDNAKERVKKEFMTKLDIIVEGKRASIKVTTFGEIITENPVANEVYGPLLKNPELLAINYINPKGGCIIVTIPSSGGRRLIRKNKKSRLRHRLRQTRRKT